MEKLGLIQNHPIRVAVLGATGVIGSDLLENARVVGFECVAFGREERPSGPLRNPVHSYELFDSLGPYNAIVNCIGYGSPERARAEANDILDVTTKFDEMAIRYLEGHPETTYIFISSGAVYFLVERLGVARLEESAARNLPVDDQYAASKLVAETRHRDLAHLKIFDVRIFNYVSIRQGLSDGFLFTDIASALHFGTELVTDDREIKRDFASGKDLLSLLKCLIDQKGNSSMDLYTAGEIAKSDLLNELSSKFGLQVRINRRESAPSPTGNKIDYLPRNKEASAYGYAPRADSLVNVVEMLKKFGAAPKDSL